VGEAIKYSNNGTIDDESAITMKRSTIIQNIIKVLRKKDVRAKDDVQTLIEEYNELGEKFGMNEITEIKSKFSPLMKDIIDEVFQSINNESDLINGYLPTPSSQKKDVTYRADSQREKGNIRRYIDEHTQSSDEHHRGR